MNDTNIDANHTLLQKKLKKLNLSSERFNYSAMSKNAEQELNDAKLKDRSYMKLQDWTKLKYYKDDWCQLMLEEYSNKEHTIPSINFKDMSVEEFRNKYEKLNIPVIIKGNTKHWKANKEWTFNNLYKRYKEAKVKIGEDDDGYKIKVYFKYYLEYLVYNKDDSPLYLFESSIENNKYLRELLSEYQVSEYFKEDLFGLVGDDKRPPHRWLLVGPERSGTSIHIDPLNTSAWNASILGHKLWLLLPPETPRHIVKGKEVIDDDEDDEAIMYFRNIFPKIKKKYGDEVKETIFVQKPGETVFIPGGWWHVVVNLDDTIAITQNYCNSVNFPKVWKSVRKERKKMSFRFLNELKENFPELYQQAIEINNLDDFHMYDKEKFLKKKLNSERGDNKTNINTSDATSSSSSSSSSSSDSDE